MDIELLELYKRVVNIWKSAASDLDKVCDNHFWAEAEVEEAVIEARDREISAIDEQIRKIHLETKEEKQPTYDEEIQAKRKELKSYCVSQVCSKCIFNGDCHDWEIGHEKEVEEDYEKLRKIMKSI